VLKKMKNLLETPRIARLRQGYGVAGTDDVDNRKMTEAQREKLRFRHSCLPSFLPFERNRDFLRCKTRPVRVRRDSIEPTISTDNGQTLPQSREPSFFRFLTSASGLAQDR